MLFNLKKRILSLPPVTATIELSKKIVLPGFDGLPIYDIIKAFLGGFQNASFKTRASALAFNFFLAIFPAIIFIFTLIPYIPIENFQDQLLILLHDVLPFNAYEAAKSTLEDIVKNQRGDLLSIGFVTALFFSTSGTLALIESFNKTDHRKETRSPLKQRLTAFFLTCVLSILIITAILLIVTSEFVLNYFLKHGLLKENYLITLLIIGKWIIIVGLYFFAISFLYYFGPAKHMKFRFISAGSTLATLLSIIASILFAFYVNNFSNYNKLYGSIGTLIVIMLWLFFNSLILLVGFELNRSIQSAGKNKKSVVDVTL